MKQHSVFYLIFITIFFVASCHSFQKEDDQPKLSKMQRKVAEYQTVKLTTDLSVLSENDKKVIPLLIEASDLIDDIFWLQAYGGKEALLQLYKGEDTLKYIHINYGPWDRLDGNKPFIEKIGPKPLGAGFYPADMQYDEFEEFDDPDKYSLYTLVRRDIDNNLICVPYAVAYKAKIENIAKLLNQAADITENESLKAYFAKRAAAFLNDDYKESDIAWMNIKDNNLDFIIGPIQDLEDRKFGAKAGHEAILLVRDKQWSKKLEKYALLIPFLQKELPCDEKYKQELPLETSEIGVYDVIYNMGYSNAGSKLIAINLPLDSQIPVIKGNRKLQFKNAIKAKFDHILLPISDIVIDDDQRQHVKFDAFFQNSIFWEVGFVLGVTNTINDKGTVKDALKEYHNVLNNCKADLLSLYFITKLKKMGEMDVDLMDNYVTYMASIFRSVRFGATNVQGKANMISFYYLEEQGAFMRNEKDGTYKIDFELMQKVLMDLAEQIVVIQANGDFKAARALVQEKGFIREDLYNDLVRIAKSRIPKDIVYDQGLDVLGLK